MVYSNCTHPQGFEVTEAQSKDLINYACIIGSEDSHLEDSLKVSVCCIVRHQ